ncbi:MAG: DUF4956 domain-containing protein [Bacillus sp. (in: Bacteria)]|nr:DUF4956 domain-containing protein [Bacillus sp. (in: firmicutes)]MCM1426053.1 DUF4956 domain-containing protein [Eubacterium sp.]
MSKSDILEWFTANNEALQADRIVFILMIGILVGAIIFMTYRIAYQGVSYNAKFNVGNVVLVLIAATIMLMISSNIAISLGMVGALSIVRFRTAIKDPQDTIYIFWAIIEGLCVGAQIYKLALISTLIIALFILAGSFYYAVKKKYLIVIHGGKDVKQDEVMDCLKKHYKHPQVRSANFSDSRCELICEVDAKGEISQEATEELRKINNVESVSWLLEMGEHVG